MPQLERLDLLDLVSQYFNDNDTGDVTPADARLVLTALINSVLLPASDSLDQWPAILPGATYQPGDQGIAEVESRLRLFKARRLLQPSAFGGAVPLPTGLASDPNWREVSPEGSQYVGYEVVSRQLAVNLLDDELAVAGRLYYVLGGAGAGRDVLVRGLGSGALEPDGYVVVAATADNPVVSYYAARLDVRVSYAEPLGVEAISRADLLARLADRPQLLVGKLYAIARPASGTDPALTVYGTFDAPGGRVCELARRSDQPGLWRYNVTTNTLVSINEGLLSLSALTTALLAKVDNAVKLKFGNTLVFTENAHYQVAAGTSDAKVYSNEPQVVFDFTNAVRGATVRFPHKGNALPLLPTQCGSPMGGYISNTYNILWFTYIDGNTVDVAIGQR